tara:strand:+ start:3079 stop:3714 length:636 start_codon:yes stop_codon:yes gene_type:complete
LYLNLHKTHISEYLKKIAKDLYNENMMKKYFKMPVKIQFKQVVISKFLNIIVFNLLWVGLVLGRESLIYLTFPSLLIYLACLIHIGNLKLYQILLPALIGIAIDSSLTFFGIFIFPESSLIIPFWLIVLWINFSTTLTLSLSFIGKNKLVAFGLGATALPFNYTVGERLGAVTFHEPYIFSILILVLVWSISFPILFIVSDENFIKRLRIR